MLNNKIYQFTARFLTILLAGAFLVFTFVGGATLKNVVTVLTLAMFFLGFPVMNRSNKIVCGILFALGVFFLFTTGADYPTWQSAILKGLGTMVLLVFASILSMPFFYRPYSEELKNVCDRYVSSPTVFLAVTLLISFVLGFYMSIAAIPLIYSLLSDIAKQYKCHTTFVMVIATSNSLTMMCAPSVSAGVVPAAAGITYSQMLTYGGIAAIILCILTVFVFKGYAKREGAQDITNDPSVNVDFGNIVTLIVVFGVLIALILCIDNFTSISLLAGISMLAIPFAFVMAIIQKRTDVFKERMQLYYNKTMLTNPNVLAITGICCFAGEGLKRAEFIKMALTFFSNNPSLYLLFPLIVFAVASIFAVIGVHPHAIGAILAGILSAELLKTNAIGFALICLIPWSIGLAINPFGATGTLCSVSSGLNVFDFTARSTWKWTATMIAAGTIITDIVTILL